ncbi:unnamed protein product [Citrullus colocynthis]|uniref:Uncharacterized protein n=1 Tax=Citrullus colocynthis TaxID=252529 RepID=A0ABP0YD77_9ROSI
MYQAWLGGINRTVQDDADRGKGGATWATLHKSESGHGLRQEQHDVDLVEATGSSEQRRAVGGRRCVGQQR